MPAALAGTVALVAVATALAATPEPEPVDTSTPWASQGRLHIERFVDCRAVRRGQAP